MALSKVDYNSLNVTAAASKALKWNSGADGFETGDVAGAMVLLDTFTSDGSDDTATFASSIDSTYKEYIFKFYDIHPESDSKNFQVNFRDGGSAYDATKTSTYFRANHNEANTATSLAYDGALHLAQGTGVQGLTENSGNDNDQCSSGYLHLYDPSSTTFVKHYIARVNTTIGGDYSIDNYVAGYCNVTAAIDGVQFSFSADEIQAGTIKMYGVA